VLTIVFVLSERMIMQRNNGAVRPAFTLIEVMLAIALTAIVMTPLLITQGSFLRAVARSSDRMERLFLAENNMFDEQALAHGQTKYVHAHTVQDPRTDFLFERMAIDSKSSLAKVRNLVLDRVTIKWQDESKQQQEVLVCFQYNKSQSKA
jgi:prepilin-type N-terminal cleavage/methylation domain-containing protein